MYVRDHQRPAFHKALGVDPDWYAHEVFTKTSEISKQVFPLTLDIDHPRWQKGLEALQRANADLADAKKSGNVFKRIGASARAAWPSSGSTPSRPSRTAFPSDTRLEPAY
jgi:magnesium-protoporphyrin IX monomethyl ester (oxidative) cyclase